MKHLILTMGLALLCLYQNASGINWIGGNGNWNDPANWSTGTIPTALDDAIVLSGVTVTIPAGYPAVARMLVMSSSASTLNIFSNASLTLGNTSGNNNGLVINGTANNSGTITIDQVNPTTGFGVGNGLYVNGTFNNNAAGIINISNTFASAIFLYNTSNSTKTFTNQGQININGGIGLRGIDFYDNDPVIFNNTGGTVNIQGTGEKGIYLIRGNTLNNGGNINFISSIGDHAISVFGGGGTATLANFASGSIVISHAVNYGLEISVNALFTNNGYLEIGPGVQNNGFQAYTHFTNSACGTIVTARKINFTSGNTFTNNGWVVSTFTGSHTLAAGSANNGIIQDNPAAFPGSFTNNRAIIQKINGSYCTGDVVSNALKLGSLSGFTITGNAWYTDSGLTTSAGAYHTAANQFTPNANATGLNVFYIRFNNTAGGCFKIMQVEFENPIQNCGSTCAAPREITSLPYTYSGSTNGVGDDYDQNDACASQSMTGDDFVFSYNAPGGQVARIKLEKTGGPNNNSAHAVFLLDGCPDDPGTSCIASAVYPPSETNNDPVFIETANLTAGTYYIVVSSQAFYHQWFDFTLTIDLPAGNICENAINIPALPYTFSGTNYLLGNDYNQTDICNSSWMTGNDVVFQYNAPGGQVARIKLEKTGGPTGNTNSAHAVFLLDGCPDVPGSTCIATAVFPPSSTNNNPVYIETANLTAGTYFIVVSSLGIYHEWFDFTLTIDLPTGNICGNAAGVASFPFFAAGQTTCLFGNDYNNTDACNSAYMTGSDYVYQLTPAFSGTIDISLSNLGQTHSAIFFLDGCPDAGGTTCLGSAINTGAGNYSLTNQPVTGGNTYYVVISSSFFNSSCVDYDIAITQAILPVELSYFLVNKHGESTAHLQWESASELHFNHYEIERSREGMEWEKIGEKLARGGISVTAYEFFDDLNSLVKATPNNPFYYRLKMVDMDGSYEFSPIKNVRFEHGDAGFTVYPNPTPGGLYLRPHMTPKGPLQAILTDVTGSVVLAKGVDLPLDGTVLFEKEEMPGAGVYFLRVLESGEIVCQKKVMVMDY